MLSLLGRFIRNSFMKTKKHKIKVQPKDYLSGFVVDLRSEDKKGGMNKRHQDDQSDRIFISKNENILKSDSVKPKNQLSEARFGEENRKKNSFFISQTNNSISQDGKRKKGPFFYILKKTFLFSIFFFLFKIIWSIIWFFLEWLIDIFKFIKKNIFFIKTTKKITPPKLPLKFSSSNFNDKKKDFKKNNFVYTVSSNIKNISKKKKKRALWFFILVLFLIIVPFKIFNYYFLIKNNSIKSNVVQYSTNGVENFLLASNSFSDLDLSSAQKNFLQAGQNFLLLDEELKKVDEFIIFLASFSKNKEIKLASESKNIAKLGLHIASAGDNFSLAVNGLLQFFSNPQKSGSESFSDFYYYGKKTENDIKKANKYLKKIKISSVPEEYRQQFLEIREKFEIIEKNFSSFLKIAPGLQDFLGIDSDRRYLVVFQNNSELRATGGFIGSYALIDLKNGKINNIEIPSGGSYDTEGGMQVLVEAPRPLQLVKPVWYFWDANWWPDWKMSAKNLMWFYEKSGGSSVDGVISLTPDVLGDILKVIGPVDLTEKYGVVVDADNFWEIIQEIVEVIGQPELFQDKDLKTDILSRVSLDNNLASSSREVVEDLNLNDPIEGNIESNASDTDQFLRNEPKKIIGDLMVEIMDKFSHDFSQELLVKTLKILENNLSQKNILLYFSNSQIQEEAENRLWAGRINESPLDYLMIVYSNIAGGKTDKVIDSNFSLTTIIEEDGSIINHLIINRKHLGAKQELFTGVRNVNWLRIYVPLGSSLISAKGFSQPDSIYFKKPEDFYQKNDVLEKSENRAEIDLLSGTKIYQEANKTVFANWSMIDPGQEDIIEIKYKLPYNFNNEFSNIPQNNFFNLLKQEKIFNYSLLWQKQPGSGDNNFTFNLINKLGQDVFWFHPENISRKDNSLFLSDKLEFDKYLAIVFK